MALAEFVARADHSWLRDLRPDPDAERHKPNKSSREVKSGHWVPVRPTALKRPKLVIFSPGMAEELGLSEVACSSDDFLRFFSGDADALPGLKTWATPYALSIMGKPLYDNCPFKNGNGYGDGRAISVGEVVSPSGKRWEMQLKGAGQTPFCRGADGRAVLRSSVREFLASEAMHHLGISTTRALSLIVSQGDTVGRAWYSGDRDTASASDDPRLANIPPQMREMLMQMLREQSGEPDVMVDEACAITCRVAPSFARIGHLDLFARRAAKSGATEAQREEHRMMVQHAINREFPELLPGASLAERALAFFGSSVESIAELVAGWLRVGFCQGNFNCDNCLVAGRTMDYGPFGFMDKYDPHFAKWVGSGQHFAFRNQPEAALANLGTLAKSLEPLLDSAGIEALNAKKQAANEIVQRVVDIMWCRKLGLLAGIDAARDAGRSLFNEVETLLKDSSADYVMLFRLLGPVAAGAPHASEAALLEPLQIAFYEPLTASLEDRWRQWVQKWLRLLADDGGLSSAAARMASVNPKYVLREHMLVDAYNAAREGDFSTVHELHTLIQDPYSEQPALEAKYFRRAPDAALSRGGTAIMT